MSFFAYLIKLLYLKFDIFSLENQFDSSPKHLKSKHKNMKK